MHTYEGRYPMLHADLYRLESPREIVDLGLDEMLEAPWVVLIEWGERAAGLLTGDYLEVGLSWDPSDDDARMIEIRPLGRWRGRMRELSEALGAELAEGA
jgi:tRNA A37 threonylcarbamoyladenosine biosynthesis protein TsaE